MNLRNFLKNHFYLAEYVQFLDKDVFLHTYEYEEIFTNSFFTDLLLDDFNWSIRKDGLGSMYLYLVEK